LMPDWFVTMHPKSEGIRRGFHRLALFLAGTLLVIGLVLMALDVADLSRFRPKEIPSHILSLCLGAVSLAFACMAVWALVDALGWVVSRILLATETQPEPEVPLT
jgi:hypothetical protein